MVLLTDRTQIGLTIARLIYHFCNLILINYYREN